MGLSKFTLSLLAILALASSTYAATTRKTAARTPTAIEIKDSEATESRAKFTLSESPISRITPQMGVSIMSAAGIKEQGVGSTTGFVGGVTGDIGQGDLVMETGLLYRQAGASAKVPDSNFDMTLTTDYLSVPVLAKFYVNGVAAPAAFYLRGGFMPSLLVREKATATVGTRNITVSNLNETETFDLPIAVGGGTKLRMTDEIEALVGIDYMRSLTKINKTGNESVYHTGVTLTAGAGFTF